MIFEKKRRARKQHEWKAKTVKEIRFSKGDTLFASEAVASSIASMAKRNPTESLRTRLTRMNFQSDDKKYVLSELRE